MVEEQIDELGQDSPDDHTEEEIEGAAEAQGMDVEDDDAEEGEIDEDESGDDLDEEDLDDEDLSDEEDEDEDLDEDVEPGEEEEIAA